MNIKEVYHFLFYKIYKFIKNVSVPEFWSEWKAIMLIIILEIALYFSVGMYYSVFINRYTTLLDNNFLIGLYLVSTIALNYYFFEHQNKWKLIIEKFDKLIKNKNIIGGWLVLLVIILVVVSLIYSFYLTSQIDWKQYQKIK